MTRVLLTIPHYYRPTAVAPDGRPHGSVARDPGPRVAALAACLRSLRLTFAPRAGVLDHAARLARRVEPADPVAVDVVVCTAGGHHLLDRLPADAGPWAHHATAADPPLLGYECHAVLRDRLGAYDFYGYLEDDLVATDPWFFQKLRWFNRLAGDACVLQPNRYEAGPHPGVDKLYVDGPLPEHCLAQAVARVPAWVAEALGREVTFRTTTNPHAGCFFLTGPQMAYWAGRPWFLDRSSAFVGSLESAATLGLATTFAVYKPALESADFLEVRHHGSAYLSMVAAEP